jgi:tight adherence protein C
VALARWGPPPPRLRRLVDDRARVAPPAIARPGSGTGASTGRQGIGNGTGSGAGATDQGGASGRAGRRAAEHGRRLILCVGQLALRLAGRPSPDLALARRLGNTIAVFALTAPVSLPAAPLAAAATWLVPAAAIRRQERRRQAEVAHSLPEIVDLLSLAVGAGLTVGKAVEAVGHRAGGPVADELARVVTEARLGASLADTLEALPSRLGEEVRPLSAVLVACERYGAPATSGLDRLGTELRAERRRRAEEAARRVPVKLLFPLVCCILPAFALLTVAPLIASAARSLRL